MIYIVGNDTNNLYVDTRVENKDNGLDYYSFYSLKYELTQKEYSDLYSFSEKSCVESAFFVQELSYQRTPQVIAETNMTKSLYDSWGKFFKDKYSQYTIDVFDNNNVTFNLISIDLENQTLKCKFSSRNNGKVINEESFREADLISAYASQKISTIKNSNILNSPDSIGFQTIEKFDEYKNNPVSIVCFELQHKTLFAYNMLSKQNNIDINT